MANAVGIIKNAKNGVIFCCNGNRSEDQMLNLKTHFNSKPFDIKILDHKGVDIVVAGTPFVSDIVFNDEQKKLLLLPNYREIKTDPNNYFYRVNKILERDYPEQFPCHIVGKLFHHFNEHKKLELQAVDYNDPENWAFTYKMRGFTDLYCTTNSHLPDLKHGHVNSYTESVLISAIKYVKKKEGSYNDRYNSNSSLGNYHLSDDDYSNDEHDESTEEDDRGYDPVFDEKYYINLGRFDNCYNKLREKARMKTGMVACDTNHFETLKNVLLKMKAKHTRAYIYVEYIENIVPKHINIEERQYKQTKLYDLYDAWSLTPYGTIIETSMSPQIKDSKSYYSDDEDDDDDDEPYEELNDAAISYYNKKQGIVLIGELNDTIDEDEDIYIPDVYFESI